MHIILITGKSFMENVNVRVIVTQIILDIFVLLNLVRISEINILIISVRPFSTTPYLLIR